MKTSCIFLLLAAGLILGCSSIDEKLEIRQKAIKNDRKLIWNTGKPAECDDQFQVIRFEYDHDNPERDIHILAQSDKCLVMMQIYHEKNSEAVGCSNLLLTTPQKETSYTDINRLLKLTFNGWSYRIQLNFRDPQEGEKELTMYLPEGLDGDPFRPYFAGY
ncbi:MAG: hypothetical protein KDK38_00355 [Leptospiraceae bacterium]|nr:hypothetical protein [Leptospiraceae bacterium]